jgi:hypothetical protein
MLLALHAPLHVEVESTEPILTTCTSLSGINGSIHAHSQAPMTCINSLADSSLITISSIDNFFILLPIIMFNTKNLARNIILKKQA